MPTSFFVSQPLCLGRLGDEKEVEIHSDAPRCNVDGIWYKPNDAVVVLDAALGKYSAKYLYLSNDEVRARKK